MILIDRRKYLRLQPLISAPSIKRIADHGYTEAKAYPTTWE